MKKRSPQKSKHRKPTKPKPSTKPKPLKEKIKSYSRANRYGGISWVKAYKRKKVKPWNKGKKIAKVEVVRFKGKPPRKPKVKPITVRPLKPRKRRPPAPPSGYRLTEHIESVEPVDRVGYTIRIVALVDFNYKYPMSFSPEDFRGKPAPNAKHLQYYHTDFTATKEEAFIDFREKVPMMRAYGDIEFLDLQLMRVSGDGPITERHYKVLHEFATPEDVPGFNDRD